MAYGRTYTHTLADLDTDHSNALANFAKGHGPKWKAALELCWYRASYPNSPADEGSYLQAIRNHPSYGPEWLARVKLVVAPVYKRVAITFIDETEEFRVFPLDISAKRQEAIASYETDYQGALGTARALAGAEGKIIDKTPRSKRAAD